MMIIAEMHGWNYRTTLWFGSMALVAVVLILASIAVFVRREKRVED